MWSSFFYTHYEMRKIVSTTVKNFNMNRVKDFKDTFKPVACVLYFAWNNKNLASPIEDLEARASTVTLCFYFLTCSPWASLADSFITTTLHTPPPVSTAWIAYISVSQPLWDRDPVNSFFIRRGPGPNKFTCKYLPIFLSSYIKLK